MSDIIERIERGMSEWISVAERLPEQGQKIDVWSKDGRDTDCIFDNGKFTLGDDYYIVIDGVTHWMPLPAPPRAVEAGACNLCEPERTCENGPQCK